MARKRNIRPLLYTGMAALLSFAVISVRADDSAETKQQLQELKLQNQALQEQLRQQQLLIDSLTRKVNQIQEQGEKRNRELEKLETQAKENEPVTKPSGFSLGKISISGEGGVAFFDTGPQGLFPNSEFVVDEAKLFVEAPIWNDVYFFSEINFTTREQGNVNLKLGELYLDFENVSKLWGQDRTLNLRLGRLDTPFGEEYLYRDAIDNPLISHSLPDFWGVDEGIELYGKAGKFTYALAVQNGGIPDTRDFDSDKSVAGRLGFDPLNWLHLSVSGMRTGDLDVQGDFLSAMWFGNGFFESIGSDTTTKFHAEMVQGDLRMRLPHGHIAAFGGYARYGDNDPTANNRRELYYYSLEGVHDLTHKLYAGVRFSQIFAHKGYPIAGQGDMGEYFFNPFALTDNIWRLSLGLGYRWSPNLVTKAEYSFERGTMIGSAQRNEEDLFALQAAFKF